MELYKTRFRNHNIAERRHKAFVGGNQRRKKKRFWREFEDVGCYQQQQRGRQEAQRTRGTHQP